MELPKYIDRKMLLVSSLFVIGLFCFELVIFTEFRNKTVYFFSTLFNIIFSDQVVIYVRKVLFEFFGFLSSILISITLFYFSFTAKRLPRLVCLLIFALIVLHEYSYQYIFERFSTMNDLKLSFSATSDQKFYAIFNYINLTAIFPISSYAILLFVVKPKEVIKRQILLFPIILAVLSVCLTCIFIYSPKLFFSKLPISDGLPFNSVASFVRTSYTYVFFITSNYEGIRSGVVKPEALGDELPKNNIVLVIDESVKGTNLSINNYYKDTTPFLKSLQDKNILKNWKIASSGSTQSISSFNLLISGISFGENSEIYHKTLSYPSVYQYAKIMNYKTYFLDGQQSLFWGGNYSDLKAIDTWTSIATINPQNTEVMNNDFKVAEIVKGIISRGGGNFIVVFKSGCHTPYERHFLADSARWKPFQIASRFWLEPKSELYTKQFINTYDNCISFNLDTFFQTISNDYENLPNNTVILYTSDHGQNFGEDGAKQSHGGTAKVEATVPLFILGKLPNEVDTNFKASHENIFPTLLDLMNYPTELRKINYAVSLLKAKESDSKVRYFFNPDLNLDEKLQFDE
jgi:glucan phosphoethanolaminetransferase (alkaline phosphatase superfamily)